MRSMATNGTRVEWQKYLRIRPGEKKKGRYTKQANGFETYEYFSCFFPLYVRQPMGLQYIAKK
jgi:hypothetical protein